MNNAATNSLKIVFAGTPEFGLPALKALHQSRHEVVAIYTQPDKPSGRGLTVHYSPIKNFGLEHDIAIYQPLNFKTEESLATLAKIKPDLMVVIAYGIILPKSVLSIPKFGCINVHASLLPRWRGASPIQKAILAGDSHSGITIMQMDEGMDTGAILKTASCMLSVNETALSLHDKLSELSVPALRSTLDDLTNHQLESYPQDQNEATYAKKIKKEDAKIDWSQKAVEIERQVRAYYPWPVAYTNTNQQLMRIFEASAVDEEINAPPGLVLSINDKGFMVATGEKVLAIQRLQFAGGKVLYVSDWLHSNQAKHLLNTILE